jgi:FtsP/CotA-like multicopper oxidase with cupredoxin domain
LPLRLGQPVIVRYENQLDTETSVHLHGGHSPSHADGFPTFYILPGKSRDYFYPNIVPLKPDKSANGASQ